MRWFTMVFIGAGLGCPRPEPPILMAIRPPVPVLPKTNVEACSTFVQTLRGLPCVDRRTAPRVNQMCPPALDLTSVNLVTYYGCMRRTLRCDGELPAFHGMSACTHDFE